MCYLSIILNDKIISFALLYIFTLILYNYIISHLTYKFNTIINLLLIGLLILFFSNIDYMLTVENSKNLGFHSPLFFIIFIFACFFTLNFCSVAHLGNEVYFKRYFGATAQYQINKIHKIKTLTTPNFKLCKIIINDGEQIKTFYSSSRRLFSLKINDDLEEELTSLKELFVSKNQA